MLFFEEFIKKFENSKEVLKDKEKFGLETLQKIGKFGIIIPLFAISAYWVFLGIAGERIKYINIMIGILILLLGMWQLRSLFLFGITIDKKDRCLKSREIDLLFDDIEKCTLEEATFKRGIRPALDIIYKDKDVKKRLLIPLIMTKKIRFVSYFRDMLADKFHIKK